MAIKVEKRMVEVYTTSDGKKYTDREWAEEHERQITEKTYLITYHFTGIYSARVQAANEEEAKKKIKIIEYPYPEDIEWELEEMEAEEVQNGKD